MYLIITFVLQAFFRQDNNIESLQQYLIGTKTFANDAFDAVTLYCLGYAFLGDCQTQPGCNLIIPARQYSKQVITGPDGISKYLLVFYPV
jgi:hypothetical protein